MTRRETWSSEVKGEMTGETQDWKTYLLSHRLENALDCFRVKDRHGGSAAAPAVKSVNHINCCIYQVTTQGGVAESLIESAEGEIRDR